MAKNLNAEGEEVYSTTVDSYCAVRKSVYNQIYKRLYRKIYKKVTRVVREQVGFHIKHMIWDELKKKAGDQA